MINIRKATLYFRCSAYFLILCTLHFYTNVVNIVFFRIMRIVFLQCCCIHCISAYYVHCNFTCYVRCVFAYYVHYMYLYTFKFHIFWMRKFPRSTDNYHYSRRNDLDIFVEISWNLCHFPNSLLIIALLATCYINSCTACIRSRN